MPQYGSLTTTEQSSLKTLVSRLIRNPSNAIWISGLSDINDYVLFIETDRYLESEKGPGSFNINRATVILDNRDGTFFADGESLIAFNAKIQIWAGFDDLLVPIFAGVVRKVSPLFGTNKVELRCADFMILLYDNEVAGTVGINVTPKSIAESFCVSIGTTSSISSTTELTTTYVDPVFRRMTMLGALEEICASIFHVAYFDEVGILQMKEREYRQDSEWTFTEDIIASDGVEFMAPTTIINYSIMEYGENLFAFFKDQSSIDTYKESRRTQRVLICNSTIADEHISGLGEIELTYDESAIKFTTSSDTDIVDNLRLKLRQSEASGYISVSIYTDSSGSPGSLVASYNDIAAKNIATIVSWVSFYSPTPFILSPSTDYWIVIDLSGVTGSVYLSHDTSNNSDLFAYYSGSWVLVDNIKALYQVVGSLEANNAVTDRVNFYKEPKERIRLISNAIPFLQMQDRVSVSIKTMNDIEMNGVFVLDHVKHRVTVDEYITTHTMYRIG